MTETGSGYAPCACRDCMEIAVADDAAGALCTACDAAGCSESATATRERVVCRRCGAGYECSVGWPWRNDPRCGACGATAVRCWPLSACQRTDTEDA